MGARALRVGWIAAVVGIASSAGAGGSGARTRITVWAAPEAVTAHGGLSYGGYAPTSGALVSERREVGSAEMQFPGVAATLDPASVQLRDLTDPESTITEQRFVRGATPPTEILQRHLGDSLEYGAKVPGGGKRTITHSVIYTW